MNTSWKRKTATPSSTSPFAVKAPDMVGGVVPVSMFNVPVDKFRTPNGPAPAS
jgi:hypothetical protein